MIIWKYKINAFGLTQLRLPKGARFLSVGEQTGGVVMWLLVEPEAVSEDRFFVVRVTGGALNPVVPTDVYLGTCQIGTYVGHVFEIEIIGA